MAGRSSFRLRGPDRGRLRAAAFAERGPIRMVHPDRLSPETLAQAIRRAWEPPAEPFAKRLTAAGIDLNGLEAVKNHLLDLMRSCRGA